MKKYIILIFLFVLFAEKTYSEKYNIKGIWTADSAVTFVFRGDTLYINDTYEGDVYVYHVDRKTGIICLCDSFGELKYMKIIKWSEDSMKLAWTDDGIGTIKDKYYFKLTKNKKQ